MECRLRQLKYSKTRNWQSRGYRIENLSIPGWKAGDPYEAVKEPWLNTLVDISWDSTSWASQVTLVVKNLAVNADDIRDVSSIPGSERSPGVEHGNSLQYSCLENSVDRGTW